MKTYLVTLVDQAGSLHYIGAQSACGCTHDMQEFVDSLNLPIVKPTVALVEDWPAHVPVPDPQLNVA